MEFGVYLHEYLGLVGWVFVLSLVFYPFELLAPAERDQPLRHRLFNLVYAPLFLAFAILVFQPIFNRLASRVLIFAGGGILPRVIGPQSGFTAQLVFAVFFAVVWDIWHTGSIVSSTPFPSCGRPTRFHHAETALNSTTQTRHHFLSQALSAVFYLPVLVLVGSQAPHFIAVFLMFRLWGFVNHSNVRLRIGPLTALISGPQWHRIHHSIRMEYQNRNFATFFPFIDILFGTYYKPAKNEYPPSGLVGDQDSGALREATIAPFLAWHKTLTRRVRSNPES